MQILFYQCYRAKFLLFYLFLSLLKKNPFILVKKNQLCINLYLKNEAFRKNFIKELIKIINKIMF